MIRQRFLITAILLVAIFSWPATLVYDFFYSGIHTNVSSFKVYSGEPAPTVIKRLYQEKIIRHPWIFNMMLILQSDRQRLSFGEYQIEPTLSPSQLLSHMIKGTGLIKHRITLVEGWTFSDIRNALSADPDLKKTITTLNDGSIVSLFEKKDAPSSPEGLFYPDTYFFTWENTDTSVLKTAFQKMQILLQTAWRSRADHLPYQNAYQALIAASLIERETAILAEKPIIASVILNRLQKNMRLQIDPTVQYGLHESFSHTITQKDLDTKTPYNTYLISGLPPTPICMPSRSSIEAALHPVQTRYLYYVATGNGGHYFSESYAQHIQAVEKYRHKVNTL